MMKIVNDRSTYHRFSFYFDYNNLVVAFCRHLKEKWGWREFGFDATKKAWVFSKYAIAEELVDHYPGVSVDEDILEGIKLDKVKEAEVVIRRDTALKIKDATDTAFEPQHVKGKLYEYQKIGVEFLVNAKGRGIIADEMGLGKTLQVLAYMAHEKLSRTLIVCPASVKYNWENEVKKWTSLKPMVITPKSKQKDFLNPAVHAFIINYDLLRKHFDVLQAMRFDLLVCDEAHLCFSYDSLVMTEDGLKKIGDIVEKKMDLSVASFNVSGSVIEYKKILNHFKVFRTERIVRVTHAYGYFDCTENHKIYTDKGWKKAISLSPGEKLLKLPKDFFSEKKRQVDSCLLQRSLCGNSCHAEASDEGYINKKESRVDGETLSHLQKNFCYKYWECIKFCQTLLRKILFSSLEGNSTMGKRELTESYTHRTTKKDRHESSVGFGKNEENEQKSCFQKKSDGGSLSVEGNSSIFCPAWWKRFFYRAAAFVAQGDWITNGTCNLNERGENTFQVTTAGLQGRFSDSVQKNSDRGRWEEPFKKEMEVFGQTENGCTESSWVVSVEVQERGGNDGQRQSHSDDTFVYDIEVEDNHNYFVDNVLVSNCKSAKAQRTKLVRFLAQRLPRLVFLSGTPFLNRPSELYTLLDALEPGAWGHWMEFTRKYCGGSQGRFGWEADGVTNLEEFKARLAPLFIRRKKAEVLLELPDKIRMNVPVDLDASAKSEYDHALNDLHDYLLEAKNKTYEEADRAMQAEGLVRLNELRQITTRGKMSAVKEIVKNILEAGDKVIIFSCYNEPLIELKQEYGDEAVMILGSTPLEERQANVDAYQNDPSKKVFLGGIKSAGSGITLTAGNNVIFMDYSWTPADHAQAQDRAFRIGQKKSVNVYQVWAKDTIDAYMVNVLNQKEALFNAIIEGHVPQAADTENVVQALLKKIEKKEEFVVENDSAYQNNEL